MSSFLSGQTDGRTGMLTLVVTVLNFAKAPKKCFCHSPARHVLWRVTLLVLLVVHLPQRAAQLARLHSVQTHVEFLAVLRMRELWMCHRLAVAVCLRLLRALEPVLQLACSNTAQRKVSESDWQLTKVTM